MTAGLERQIGSASIWNPASGWGLLANRDPARPLALAILRLHKPPARIESGRVILAGSDILQLDREALRRMRWKEMSFIPQGAMNSLNPVMRIRHQIADAIRAHAPAWSGAQIRRRIEELLERVGLAKQAADLYPHELSGGMKQRVCIALAIVLEPKLIVADEPTSALDVVVQRIVMETLKDVQKQINAAMIVIGHDMGLMAQSVDRLAVFYAGRMVDTAPVRDFFRQPLHPYSQALITSLPSLKERKPLTGIPGMQPPLFDLPSGCPFHPRCSLAEARCKVTAPDLSVLAPQRSVACHIIKERINDQHQST